VIRTPRAWFEQASDADFALKIADRCLAWAPGDLFWLSVQAIAIKAGGKRSEH
jgi:hypothetical protein